MTTPERGTSGIADDGLYLHEKSDAMPGVTVLRQRVDDRETVWVAAGDFMAVQKARDDARRVLALLNMLRVTDDLPQSATVLLDRYGLGRKDAEAMASIVASVRSGL